MVCGQRSGPSCVLASPFFPSHIAAAASPNPTPVCACSFRRRLGLLGPLGPTDPRPHRQAAAGGDHSGATRIGLPLSRPSVDDAIIDLALYTQCQISLARNRTRHFIFSLLSCDAARYGMSSRQ